MKATIWIRYSPKGYSIRVNQTLIKTLKTELVSLAYAEAIAQSLRVFGIEVEIRRGSV